MIDEKTLQLLIDKAPAMREAGIRTLSIGETCITLDPPETPIDVAAKAPADTSDLDALMDATTYGMKGGGVPGFPRARKVSY